VTFIPKFLYVLISQGEISILVEFPPSIRQFAKLLKRAVSKPFAEWGAAHFELSWSERRTANKSRGANLRCTSAEKMESYEDLSRM
jgi:hypothetical protein